MKAFFQCALHVGIAGILMRYIGNLYDRNWFLWDKFPFRPFGWEKSGKLYRKLRVKKWKDRVPDASKKHKNMYEKKVNIQPDKENLRRLIQETCVAELVHYQLIVLSLPVLKIWPGPAGLIIFCLCVVGNLVFAIIQRYNRPRLIRALERLERIDSKKEKNKNSPP